MRRKGSCFQLLLLVCAALLVLVPLTAATECPCALTKQQPCACAVEAEAVDSLKIAPEYKAGAATTTTTTTTAAMSPAKVVSATPAATAPTTTTATAAHSNIYLVTKPLAAVPTKAAVAAAAKAAAAKASVSPAVAAAQRKATMAAASVLDKVTGAVKKGTAPSTAKAIPDVVDTNPTSVQAQKLAATATSDVKSISASIANIKNDLVAHRQREAVRAVKEKIAHLEKQLLAGQASALQATAKVAKVGTSVGSVATDVSGIKSQLSVLRTKNLADDVAQAKKEAAAAAKELSINAELKTQRLKLKGLETRLWRDETRRAKLIGKVTSVKAKKAQALAAQRKRAQLRRQRFVAQAKAARAQRRLAREKASKATAGKESLRKLRRRIRRRQRRESAAKKELRAKYNVKEHNHKLTVRESHHKVALKHKEALTKKVTAHKLAQQRKVNEHLIKIYNKDMEAVRKQLHQAKKTLYATMSETKVKHLKRRHAWLLARRRKLRAETVRQQKQLMKAKHAAAVAKKTLGTRLAKAQSVIMHEANAKRRRFHTMKLEAKRKQAAHNAREKRRQLKEKNTKKRRHAHWVARQARHAAHQQEVATKHAKARQLHLAKLQWARQHAEKKQKHFWAKEKLQKKKEWHSKMQMLRAKGTALRASQVKAMKLKLKAEHVRMAARLMQSLARKRARHYAAMAKTARARAFRAVRFLTEKLVKKTARKRLRLQKRQARLAARLRKINARHVKALLQEGRVKAMKASLSAAHKMRAILLASQRHIHAILAKGRKAITKHHLRLMRAKGLLRLRKARLAMKAKLQALAAKAAAKRKAWTQKMVRKHVALEKRGKTRVRNAHKEARSKHRLVLKAKSEAALKYKVHTLAAKTHLIASKKRSQALAKAAAIRASKNTNVASLHRKYVALQKRVKKERRAKSKKLHAKRKRYLRFKAIAKRHEKASKLRIIVLEGKFKTKKRALQAKRKAALARAAKMSRAHRAHIRAALKLKFQRAARRMRRARRKEKATKEKAAKVLAAKKKLWARRRALWLKLRSARRKAMAAILRARKAMFKKASMLTYHRCQHMNAEINKQVAAFDAKHCKATKGPAVIRCHWQLKVFKNKLLAQRASVCLDVNPRKCKQARTWFAKRISDVHAGCIKLKANTAARIACHKRVSAYQLRAFRTIAKLCAAEKCKHAKAVFAKKQHGKKNCHGVKNKTCRVDYKALTAACATARATGCIGAKLLYKSKTAAAARVCAQTLHVANKKRCLQKLPALRRKLHKALKKSCANKCQNAKHMRKHRAKTFLAGCGHMTGSLRKSCLLHYRRLSLVWKQREARVCREHGPCGRAHHSYHHAVQRSIAACQKAGKGFKESICYKKMHPVLMHAYKRVKKTCFLFSPAELLRRKLAAQKRAAALKAKADKARLAATAKARLAFAAKMKKLSAAKKCALSHSTYRKKVSNMSAACRKTADSRKKTLCYVRLTRRVKTWYKSVQTNCPCQHAKHSYKTKVATYSAYCAKHKAASSKGSCLASLKVFRKVWYHSMRVTCKTWHKAISRCGKAIKLLAHKRKAGKARCAKVTNVHKRNMCLFKVHGADAHWKRAMKTACAKNACGVARRSLRRNAAKSARHCARQTSHVKRHLCFVKYGILRKSWRLTAAAKCATPSSCHKAYARFNKLVKAADHKCGRLTGGRRAKCSRKVNLHRRKWFLRVHARCHTHKSWACKHKTYAWQSKVRLALQKCHTHKSGPKRTACLTAVRKSQSKKWKLKYHVTFTCSHASCAVATAVYNKKVASFSAMCKARHNKKKVASCSSSLTHHARHWYHPVKSACGAHRALVLKMKRAAARKRRLARLAKQKAALRHEARLKSRVVAKNKACGKQKLAFYKKVRVYHRRCKTLGAKNSCKRVSAGSVHKCLQAKKKYHKLVSASITACGKAKVGLRAACFAKLRKNRHLWYSAVKTQCEHAATKGCKAAKKVYSKTIKAAMTICGRKQGAARSVCVKALMTKRHVWYLAVKKQCKATKAHTKLVCTPKAGSRLAQSVCLRTLLRLKPKWYRGVTTACKGSTLGHCVTAKKSAHDKAVKQWSVCAAKKTRVLQRRCYADLRVSKATWKLSVLKQCNRKCHAVMAAFHSRVARQRIVCRWTAPARRVACNKLLVKQQRVWKAQATLKCSKHTSAALSLQRAHAKRILRVITLRRKVYSARHKCLVAKKSYWKTVRVHGKVCAKKGSHTLRAACYKQLHAKRRVWFRKVKTVCKGVKTAKKGHCGAARKLYGAKVKAALARCKGKTACLRSVRSARVRWYQRVKTACKV